jgi:hypothetical protein
MKEFLTLITFSIAALFFAVFFATLKPAVVIVAIGPSKPGYCDTKTSPGLACRSLILAAAMWPDGGQR